jgi:hypothetical protein
MMKVERVSASVRYAKEIEGAWKTVEMGAEAIVDEENWVLAQQGLFAQLSAQLREVWGWGQNGPAPGHAQNGHERPKEASWEGKSSPYPSPAEEKPALRPHFCPLHQKEFKRFEKNGQAWYSHKDGAGWCKE